MILDSYIIRRLAATLAIVFVAFLGIYIVVDLFDHAHSFIDNDVPLRMVLLYYVYSTPWIFALTAPVAMLLGVLLALGRLSRRNEIMAMKGAGISLYRILLPALVLGAILSVGTLLIGEYALPPATRARLDIEENHIGRRADARLKKDLIYMKTDGTMFLVRRYNTRALILEDVSVEEFDDNVRLTSRIDARLGRWSGDHWVLEDGDMRRFTLDGERITSFETLDLPAGEPRPDDLVRRTLTPEEMGYRELKRYIDRRRAGGADTNTLFVELRLKLAFPFATLIMTLLGAPFAVGTRKSGFAISFAAALTISFVYYGLIRVGQILGQQAVLPPGTAAWAANILFAAIGVVILVKTPK